MDCIHCELTRARAKATAWAILRTGGAPSSSHTIPRTTSEWSVGLLHFDRVRLG
jgi:hypothetical protein